ncbi:14347_t:CDS:2 [Dentiscutata erythropus]|uniref:14347_t:CDS:1 n=1 Tax=Dentiscutata erythropus TaxID=1348616 RepID=A0A9N8VD49_9GLOM|nr:14347_t:CDS:2 [Dentiscutata erythropus]
MGQKSVKGAMNKRSSIQNEETYLRPLSVFEAYRFIQGRRFRVTPNAVLTLPSDSEEAIRFNGSIKLKKKLFGSNYSAPVTKLLTCGSAKVLEVGTGGGHWLSDMALEFPMSVFLGLDLSTICNPDYLPENSAFLEHNYHDGIPFPDDTFDFIFQHAVSAKFRENLFNAHLSEMSRVLKPGGWIEVYGSPTHIVDAGPATERFISSARKCLQINGLNPDIVRTIPEKLKRLNIKNVQVAEMPLSLSRRNKISDDQIEENDQNLLLRTVEAYRVIMKVAVGCTDEDYDKLKKEVSIEIETRNMYIMSVRTFGQK